MQEAKTIFSINSEAEFKTKALEVFNYQAKENPIYNSFISHLKINIEEVDEIEKIPFLPIKFFKQFEIITGNQTPEKIFTSSGTTGMTTSKHMVTDLALYHYSLEKCFEQFYGPCTPENQGQKVTIKNYTYTCSSRKGRDESIEYTIYSWIGES